MVKLIYAVVLLGLSMFDPSLALAGFMLTLQYSTNVRNARLDTVESTIGLLPLIEFRTGAPPANCAAAATGTQLALFALPSDWMAAASGGTKAKLGTWQGNANSDIATANIGYFRIYEPGSPSACHIQGTVTATAGGGDMTVDNISCAASQQITITGFTLTAGNP